MAEFFQFESDFVESLRCIPMQVRFKLDTCGVKLKLHQWNKFGDIDRHRLVDAPCDTDAEISAYRSQLHQVIQERTGETATDLPIEANPEWHQSDRVPDSVQHKAEELGLTIQATQWASLTPLQRFALIKLSRSGHENSNFLPAMKEFQLV
jgi:hypothetical protein